MPYSNTEEQAFSSIEYIMRDVDYGWVIRYMHTTGASLFFAVVYLHMFRGLLYGSYQKPKELVWIFGCTIYLAMMAEGFLGYVLPYGQMSYWGAQVIISLFGSANFGKAKSKLAILSSVCLTIKTGCFLHETCICCPYCIFETSNLTAAPAAFAFALGFHAAINGVAANGKPDKPTALVRPINTFLLVLSLSCIKGVC